MTYPFTLGEAGHLDEHNRVAEMTFTPEMFGAAGDGTTNDQTALASALAALPSGGTLHLAGKTYAHSGTLTVAVSNVRIVGPGTLKATTEVAGSAFYVNGNNVTVDGVTFEMATQVAGRQDQLNDQKVVIQGDNVTLRNVTVNKSMAAGVFLYGASNFTASNCLVKDTLADGFHSTNGSTGGRFNDCEARNTGDDGFAVVSYGVDGTACSDFNYANCRVIGNVTGRGFAVVGGSNVTWTNCYAEDTYAAAFYIACETSFSTYGVNGVRMVQCEAVRANRAAAIDQGALFIYCSRAGYTVENVTVRDFVCTDTNTGSSGAFQDIRTFEEAGTVTGIRIESADVRGSHTDYPFDNPSGNATVNVKDVVFGDVSRGWERLAGETLGSAAATFSTLTIPPREHLMVVLRVAGMSASDRPALRFNGDTGSNYKHRHVTCAAGGTTLVNVEATAQNRAYLSGNDHGEVRQITVFITNKNDWQKVGAVLSSQYPGAMDLGSQVGWGNTSAQITSVTALSVGGNNFNAGSSIVIFGKDAT